MEGTFGEARGGDDLALHSRRLRFGALSDHYGSRARPIERRNTDKTENRRVVALAALTNGLVRGGLDQTHYFDLACRISDRKAEKTFCRFPMIGLAATFAGSPQCGVSA